MSDFPLSPITVHAGVIGSFTKAGWWECGVMHVTPASRVWAGGQFMAYYIPIRVDVPVTIVQMAWLNGTVIGGSIMAGVYDIEGNLIVATASTAQNTISIAQAADITDTLLTPNDYYLAMNCSNGAATVWGSNISAPVSKMYGVRQQAVGSLTLPDPFTPADPTTAYVPGIFALEKTVL